MFDLNGTEILHYFVNFLNVAIVLPHNKRN